MSIRTTRTAALVGAFGLSVALVGCSAAAGTADAALGSAENPVQLGVVGAEPYWEAYEAAVEAFAAVDRRQFQYLSEAAVDLAASAFVDALRAKDEVEFGCLRDGALQRTAIENADYRRVTGKLRERAAIIGMDAQYAVEKTEAWRRHKAGGEYWTPFARSQVYELRAALSDPDYPHKPRGGQSGFGPEPFRYVLAFELHDMHTERHWREGIPVMVPYYEKILERYGTDEP